MDTSVASGRPAPPPKPMAARSPGDRPKPAPRVLDKPQPPLPSRPPVATKPAKPVSPVTKAAPNVPPDADVQTGNVETGPLDASDSAPPVSAIDYIDHIKNTTPLNEDDRKVPPPLPLLPPCASTMGSCPNLTVDDQLVTAAALSEQSTSAHQQHEDNETSACSQAPAEQQGQELSGDVNDVMSVSPGKMIGGANKSISKAPPPVRPKPAVKPGVKPKPPVKKKLRSPSIEEAYPAPKTESEPITEPEEVSSASRVSEEKEESRLDEAEQLGQGEQLTARGDGQLEKSIAPAGETDSVVASPVDREDERVSPVREAIATTGGEPERLAVEAKELSGDIPDETSSDAHPDVSITDVTVSTKETASTPSRPPRKKKTSKAPSQQDKPDSSAKDGAGSHDVDSSPARTHPAKLQKQEHVDVDEVEADRSSQDSTTERRLKRVPSRKAPPPPPPLVPVEIDINGPGKEEEEGQQESQPAKKTVSDSHPQARLSGEASEIKGDVATPITPNHTDAAIESTDAQSAGSKETESTLEGVGKKAEVDARSKAAAERPTSLQSSPRPGRLNLQGIEAAMAGSIGRGLQHQLTSSGSVRPKPATKPKPPLLHPKPTKKKPGRSSSGGKAERAHSSTQPPQDGQDATKFGRNSSYSRALSSDDDDGGGPRESENNNSTAAPGEISLKASSSKRGSTQVAGVTVTSTSDQGEETPAEGEHRAPRPAGRVRVLPLELVLGKSKSLAVSDEGALSDDGGRRGASRTAAAGRERRPGMQRSKTVEALLEVDPLSTAAAAAGGSVDQRVAEVAAEVAVLRKTSSATSLPVATDGSGGRQDSREDDKQGKADSLNKGGKPIFVPPPPPPRTRTLTKTVQCPSTEEEPLEDQVFAREEARSSREEESTDDDYEEVCVRRIDEDDSSDDELGGHVYEPPPVLPPKDRPAAPVEAPKLPPVRPPKRRPRQAAPLPPPPLPTQSPPVTPLSATQPIQLGESPPLPPRDWPTPPQRRSPTDMYDGEGYLEPMRPAGEEEGDVYSYADLPAYPFEKKSPPLPARSPLNTRPPAPLRNSPGKPGPKKDSPSEDKTDNAIHPCRQDRESTWSMASVRTSGGSHIYEPIGSRSNSLSRPDTDATTGVTSPSQKDAREPVLPVQRMSGKSTFYFAAPESEPAGDDRSKDAEGSAEGQRKSQGEEAEPGVKAADAPPTSPPPQAPPRLKRRALQGELPPAPAAGRAAADSSESDESDDYIYPDDPMLTERSPAESKEEDSSVRSSGDSGAKFEEEEGIYHEADEPPPADGIYQEADDPESDGPTGKIPIDEGIYNEADDSAIESASSATSPGVVAANPPPVPPRDHHRSEPVPSAIRQALNLQRTVSAVSDAGRTNGQKSRAVLPKTVSFESQFTDSALSLSLSPASKDSPEVTPSTIDPSFLTVDGGKPRRTKPRSMSQPLLGLRQRGSGDDQSLLDDSMSTCSDRPSSWASSCDGYDDAIQGGTVLRSPAGRGFGGEHGSPNSDVLTHRGSASSLSSEPHSDLSDSELEEREKRKAKKRNKKLSHIAHEIVSSEKTFVDVLKLLNIDFRYAVAKATEAHDHPIVPGSIMNQILKQLPELQRFNECLLATLQQRIDNWETEPQIADIFVRQGPFLKMYTHYIREFENSMATFDDARRKYPEFDVAVREFEASPRCKQLLLRHYMHKPIQRIPQYRLLLQDYLKYLPPESTEYKDTQAALVIVSEVAEHANQSMKYGDNFKKLWEIQSALIGQFEVIQPGREFIKEGILQKLSRKVMQPRMFFLLSDVLLYTTPVVGGYKLNNHIPLTAMRVSLPNKEDFQNEFSILSTQRSFTISASTPEERDSWLEALREAIQDNVKRRSSFDVRRMHPSPSMSLVEVDKELTLGSRAPVWVPDARVSMCMLCTAEFSITFRRHHCRACGRVICGYCSDYRAPLRYLKYKAARVCYKCYDLLTKEFECEEELNLSRGSADGSKDSPFSRASIRSRFRGITWGSYRKSSKAKRPAVLKEIGANEETADMSGYLKVWKSRKWKKLWFVLKGKALFTFKASEDAAAIESTVLLGYEVHTFNSWFQGVEPSLVFEIRHPGTSALVFRTESPASQEKWLQAMREATMP